MTLLYYLEQSYRNTYIVSIELKKEFFKGYHNS